MWFDIRQEELGPPVRSCASKGLCPRHIFDNASLGQRFLSVVNAGNTKGAIGLDGLVCLARLLDLNSTPSGRIFIHLRSRLERSCDLDGLVGASNMTSFNERDLSDNE